MANYKVYRKGNYIIVEDSANKYWEEIAANTKISKEFVDSTEYTITFKDVKETWTMPFAEIKKVDGTSYTDVATWETWYTANTGFNAATTESVAGILASLSGKQDILVSGDNIKTINGASLLGSGNLVIAGGSGGGSGDMTMAVYDPDGDGVVDAAELIPIVVRNPSTTITLRKGTIIYLSGSTGYRPNAYKAQANAELTSSGTFGVVLSDIAPNSDGSVGAMGTVHDLDTRNTATYPFTNDVLVDGDVLWLDPVNAGYVTKTKPQAPNHIVFIGIVARTSPTLGRIIYRISNGFELEELHNVFINGTLADKHSLYYDAATSLWKTNTIAGILGYIPLSSSVNIYNANGTLTAARTVDLNGVAINFTDNIGTSVVNFSINDGADDYSYLNQILGGFNLTAGSGSFSKSFYVDNSGIGIYASGTAGRYNFPNSQPTLNQIPYAASATQLGFTSIKTINGNSVLGSGDISISSGAVDIFALKPNYTFRGIVINNNSTTVGTEGGVTMSTSASTLAQTAANTSFATKQIRLRYYASVVSGGRYSGTRGSALAWFIGGGFLYTCDVSISDTAYGSTCQQFYGMQSSLTDAAFGGVSLTAVNTLINCVGVGSDAADTNLQIFHNDATGTCTKIDLGVDFPANRTAGAAMTTVYSILIYNAPSSNEVRVKVVNNETGVSVENVITTNLPASTLGLNFFASRAMGAAVTNTGQFDLSKLGVYSIL